MSWSADEQREVSKVLLGSWPGTVTQWGKSAFAAFVGELEARGLEAGEVIAAIRTWRSDSDFPPSAPRLAEAARRDPSVPTFDEAYRLIFDVILRVRAPTTKSIYAPGERDELNREAMLERASQPDVHPLVGAFVSRSGVERLLCLGVDDPEFGGARRHQLRADWESFLEATEGREVAALASGRRGELGKLDPLDAVGGGRRELGVGS